MEELIEIEDDVDTIDKDEEVGEKKCSCHDEFKTEVCPIHFKIPDEDDKEVIIITDEHLVPEEMRQWNGYAYKCPKCGQETILHLMKYCGNCGIGLIIKSAKLTSFIEELTERNNR
jgi:ribosomal protein L37E